MICKSKQLFCCPRFFTFSEIPRKTFCPSPVRFYSFLGVAQKWENGSFQQVYIRLPCLPVVCPGVPPSPLLSLRESDRGTHRHKKGKPPKAGRLPDLALLLCYELFDFFKRQIIAFSGFYGVSVVPDNPITSAIISGYRSRPGFVKAITHLRQFAPCFGFPAFDRTFQVVPPLHAARLRWAVSLTCWAFAILRSAA